MLRLALLATLVLLTAGCGDSMSRGIVISGDGKLRANTASSQRESAQEVLANAVEEELGKGWDAQVTIDEEPRWIEDSMTRRDDVTADGYWRWDRITAAMVLIPPVGSQLASEQQDKLQQEVKAWLLTKLAKKDPAQVSLRLSLGAAPASLPPIQVAPGQRTYVIQPGDTLADISTAFYGSSQHWRLIAEANPGGTASGQSVVIPALPAPVPSAPSAP